STAFRLAKHDVKRYPDIITASENGKTPYYTNSSHLPVSYTDDIFSALDIQDELQTLYTSGTVFHAFLGERLPDWQAAAKLVQTIAQNFRLPYYTMSPTYSVCKSHGYIAGEEYTCPECGEKTEVYSRITGYYRPVQNWNDGKSQEFKERKLYDVENSVLRYDNDEQECDCTATAPAVEAKELLLFTTKTCPNCRMAKTFLDQAGLKYQVIDAEEQVELTKKFGVSQAPTLIVTDGENFERIANASEIKKYTKQA
ncbi:MAG: ribonucleoside triphosphate reductase, partial [Clostridia bacterium]|nr:ribonucleoside triphosphate reductase [Clostridia bacterium]